MALTKRDIAKQIHAADATISISEAIALVDAIFDLIKLRMRRGEKVMITNFGTFEVVQRAPRRGVNPATGERMIIPEHAAVAFHPSPAMQNSIDD